ncbi:hypothetical protein FS749_008951 [Ceratobasidium sp. UAMH 11750]|nr:hypothetical protein FS749_008951 [Ceratobasidium sp. UAMH 11750]
MSPPYPPIDEAIDQGLTRQVQSQEQEQIEQQEKETQAAERAKKKEEKEGQPAKKRKVHGPSGFRANTLTPGNFESSPGPARGWPGYNGEITLPGDQGASNNTTIPPLAVDSIANEQGLSGPQRAELHRFSKENAGVQHTQVHAHQLALDNKLAGIQSALANVQGITAQVLKTATETWNPTESQKKAVRNMCWNYLTYDLNSYLQMHEEVVTSVGADPVGILGLEGYGSEPILTDAVKAYIRTEANNVKSRFKKHIDKAVDSQQPLGELTRSTLKAHRVGFGSSTPIDDTHKVVFANYRDVAARLIKKQRLVAMSLQELEGKSSSQAQLNEKKERTLHGDSGFWKKLDEETGQRLETLGKDRMNQQWMDWRKEIITHDESCYGNSQLTATSAAIEAAITRSTAGFLRNSAVGDV